ncbi:MAG TPA: hypothetical protein VK498_09670, partial [Ferruginibacter sp.]|nr:hypothetical protein [Ferruginibacter sp.]
WVTAATMSLDNIQLTPFLIQDLYNHLLVDLETLQPKAGTGVQNNLRYLGSNKKNILVIVNDKEGVFLSETRFDLLLEILSACSLSMNDVVLFNADKNPAANYNELVSTFHPEKIILFGAEPVSLQFPLVFPYYQLQKYNQQVYLNAPSLEILSTDISQKKQLWGCLKKLFILNS